MTAEIIPFPTRPTLWERADVKRKNQHQRDAEIQAWCTALSKRGQADYVPDGDPKGAA